MPENLHLYKCLLWDHYYSTVTCCCLQISYS